MSVRGGSQVRGAGEGRELGEGAKVGSIPVEWGSSEMRAPRYLLTPPPPPPHLSQPAFRKRQNVLDFWHILNGSCRCNY